MGLIYSKIALSIPKPLLAEADRVAKAEYRTRSEVVREALREYCARRGALAGDAIVRSLPEDDEDVPPAEERRLREVAARFERGEMKMQPWQETGKGRVAGRGR